MVEHYSAAAAKNGDPSGRGLNDYGDIGRAHRLLRLRQNVGIELSEALLLGVPGTRHRGFHVYFLTRARRVYPAAVTQFAGLVWHRASEQLTPTDDRPQLIDVDRLADEFARAESRASRAASTAASNHDNRNPGERSIAQLHGPESPAVHHRQERSRTIRQVVGVLRRCFIACAPVTDDGDVVAVA